MKSNIQQKGASGRRPAKFRVSRGKAALAVVLLLSAGYAAWMGPKFYEYAYLDPAIEKRFVLGCEEEIKKHGEGQMASVASCYRFKRELLKNDIGSRRVDVAREAGEQQKLSGEQKDGQ